MDECLSGSCRNAEARLNISYRDIDKLGQLNHVVKDSEVMGRYLVVGAKTHHRVLFPRIAQFFNNLFASMPAKPTTKKADSASKKVERVDLKDPAASAHETQPKAPPQTAEQSELLLTGLLQSQNAEDLRNYLTSRNKALDSKLAELSHHVSPNVLAMVSAGAHQREQSVDESTPSLREGLASGATTASIPPKAAPTSMTPSLNSRDLTNPLGGFMVPLPTALRKVGVAPLPSLLGVPPPPSVFFSKNAPAATPILKPASPTPLSVVPDAEPTLEVRAPPSPKPQRSKSSNSLPVTGREDGLSPTLQRSPKAPSPTLNLLNIPRSLFSRIRAEAGSRSEIEESLKNFEDKEGVTSQRGLMDGLSLRNCDISAVEANTLISVFPAALEFEKGCRILPFLDALFNEHQDGSAALPKVVPSLGILPQLSPHKQLSTVTPIAMEDPVISTSSSFSSLQAPSAVFPEMISQVVGGGVASAFTPLPSKTTNTAALEQTSLPLQSTLLSSSSSSNYTSHPTLGAPVVAPIRAPMWRVKICIVANQNLHSRESKFA